MKYMLLIYGDENALTQEERSDCYQESLQLVRDLQSEGKFISTAPLHATAMSTSVRVRDGKRMVTDGPYMETKEQLGGYFMVDVADLDDAIRVANRIPGAKWGTVEIRPVVALDGLPE